MIQVENLHYTYPGNDKETIKGMNFTVRAGEIFGFLGPSGAGKSTTQKILFGILKNYSGSVILNKIEIKKVTSDFYETIGVAFEFPNFFNKLTALENLNFFRSLYQSKTLDPVELLSAVGLEQDKDVRFERYSKGMKARLNFCRALLNDAEILFLDEPTSGLDPVNQKIVKDIIRQQKSQGKTIFLTTHNMHVADEVCDHVAFITDGQINLIDSPQKLKVENGERKVKVEYYQNGNLKNQFFSMNNLADNEPFREILKNYRIETIHSQEATLEEIFIKTTGKRLI
ncbi:MAG: ABC transporter ATP-binding protein [Candidatus Marinimicrobia bacterium]|nr:ABC transporter ATP-binding protein [Candidatus Neomarinimicrobiota bacterium]